MTRVEKVARARELRVQGLKIREIAAAMGVARSTAYDYLTDPDLSRARARKGSYRGVCVDCGAATSGCNGRGPNAAMRCVACNAAMRGRENRLEWMGYRQMVEQMWAEGMTIRQMADALGWGSDLARISQLRARGYDLPYRRSAAARKRMLVGADERMAKARAARGKAAA